MSATAPIRFRAPLPWAAIAGVPLLLLAAALLQVHIDARTKTSAQQSEELLLRSPALVKKLSLGYEGLLADIYWTRAVQYYGTRLATPGAHFPVLWPLLDLTTTLDPKLIPAYRFGSIFLSEGGEIGAGQTDRAVELVKRGIAANPNQWVLYNDLGFLYYWRLKNYPEAAAVYLAGSKIPGAPVWLRLMAARVSSTGRSLETSRLIWEQLYQSTQDPKIRKTAMEQIRGLTALEDEEFLNGLAEKYKQRFHRYPVSTKELLTAGLLDRIPADPAGYPYEFEPSGKARLSPRTSLMIPAQPQVPPGIPSQTP